VLQRCLKKVSKTINYIHTNLTVKFPISHAIIEIENKARKEIQTKEEEINVVKIKKESNLKFVDERIRKMQSCCHWFCMERLSIYLLNFDLLSFCRGYEDIKRDEESKIMMSQLSI
jgi:hypothetical protein